jgi:hypothetical protein
MIVLFNKLQINRTASEIRHKNKIWMTTYKERNFNIYMDQASVFGLLTGSLVTDSEELTKQTSHTECSNYESNLQCSHHVGPCDILRWRLSVTTIPCNKTNSSHILRELLFPCFNTVPPFHLQIKK